MTDWDTIHEQFFPTELDREFAAFLDSLPKPTQVEASLRIPAELLGIVEPRETDAIRRTPVASSNLRSIGYDFRAQALEVEFHSGAIFRYLQVPHEVAEKVSRAESPGGAFAKLIRNRYTSMQLRPAGAYEEGTTSTHPA